MMGELEQSNERQARYWSYVKDRDLALKRSPQKIFLRPMPEFPTFPVTLLSSNECREKPVPSIAKIDSMIERATTNKGKVVEEELKNSTSAKLEKHVVEGKEERNVPATTPATAPAIATKKGKTFVLTSSPTSMTAQDQAIDQLIDKLTKTDE
ncbi:hypothetical protein J1N35_000557 [Gossypium stocksii]|uniref:Uncharacterized protein n=1 Tax=Gossypium stocksii TaxID=47602 RepID=A0A9D3WIB6_9ROSI|nr:hypothetical protein J1N35_000557 [Gossypium stocksii]